MEGAGEECLSKAIPARSLWEAARVGRVCGGSPAASVGLPPQDPAPSIPHHGERGGERGTGRGDKDNHTSGVNCYKYQESNQYVKMCVPLFTYMRQVNEKRREREEELERKRRDY